MGTGPPPERTTPMSSDAPMSQCRHAKPLEGYSREFADCEFVFRPHIGVCARCPKYDGPPRGVGDVIAKVTTAIGIKPCEPCKARQAALNRVLPFTTGAVPEQP
jgi:hypothetical protein